MSEPIHYSEAIDNDDPEHRRMLIAALREEGLDAYEYHSGGGLMHVVVDLVNDAPEGEDLLQIATGSVASPCDVGLIGWGPDGNVWTPEFVRTPPLADAVAAFRRFYAERTRWITAFREGWLGS